MVVSLDIDAVQFLLQQEDIGIQIDTLDGIGFTLGENFFQDYFIKNYIRQPSRSVKI